VVNIEASHSDATAAPTVQAYLLGSHLVNVRGTTDIKAFALGNAFADSEGIGGAVVQVGTSRATATWQPTIDSNVGAGSFVTSGNIFIEAFNNHNELGNADASRNANSRATATGGGVVTIEGAEANTRINSRTVAHIGAGAVLNAGNSLYVIARSRNNALGNADGKAFGLAGFGSSMVDARVRSQTIAASDDAASSNPTQIGVGNFLQFLSTASNNGNVSVNGGQGGLLAKGGALAMLLLDSPQTTARVGNFTMITGSLARVEVLARNSNDLTATATETTTAAIALNEASAAAQAKNSLTLADIGSGVRIDVDQFVLSARDDAVHASADAFGNVPFDIGGDNYAFTFADENTNARAHISGGNTDIHACTSADILAGGGIATTYSHPRTRTVGITGALHSYASSDRKINAEVVTEAVSHITTRQLTVVASQPPSGASTYVRDPETDGNTVAKVIGQVVETVCDIVGEVVCLWGLICDPKEVCHDIAHDIVQLLHSEEDPQQLGTQSVTNHVTFNTDVTMECMLNHILIIDVTGKVLELENITAHAGDFQLAVGRTVVGNRIDIDSLQSAEGTGQILVQAEGGSTSGSSRITYNSLGSALIRNDSAKDLFLHVLDIFDTANPPAVSNRAIKGQAKWSYTVAATTLANDTSIDVENTNVLAGDITLLGRISNPIGTTILRSQGGNIESSGRGAFIQTRLVDLRADRGEVGNGNARIVLQFAISMDLTSGIQQAYGERGVYLDILAGTTVADLALQFEINNVHAGQGNVDIRINDSQRISYVLANLVTIRGGTTFRGVPFGGFFTPTRAVNSAADTIDLGYTHGLNTGEEVVYVNGDGRSIAGLTDGSIYRVRVINATTVQLGDTFDPQRAVNNTYDTITFPYIHDFVNGQQVAYDNGGTANIIGLVNGQTYFVRVIDPNTIKLALTLADALAKPFKFEPLKAVDNQRHTINFGVNHGFKTGQAVTYRADGTPLHWFIGEFIPQQLNDRQTYYVIVVNATTIQLAASLADAQQGRALAIAAFNDVSGIHTIGIEGIPLNAGNANGTQMLRLPVDAKQATGDQHRLIVSGSFYLQDASKVYRIRAAEVTKYTYDAAAVLLRQDSGIVLRKIDSTAGYVRIINGGQDVQARANFVLMDRIASPAGSTTLFTARGSIVSGSPGHVIDARDIFLTASEGAIGTATNNVRTVLRGGHLNASAQGDIHITEAAGAMNVGAIDSAGGNVILSVRDSAPLGEDLMLDSSATITAAGAVTLNGADDIQIAAGSIITARGIVTINGDVNDADPGVGSMMNIFGTIRAASVLVVTNSSNDVINLSRLDTTPTTVRTNGRNTTVNVRAINAPMAIQSAGGSDLIKVGSTAGQTGNPPGMVNTIQAALTVTGNGTDTLNVDDTGSTVAKTGTLTPTTLTGLGMGAGGITYSGLAALNIKLGSGGNSLAINDISPATPTAVDGGSSASDSLTATFAQDFNGTLTLLGLEMATVQVTRDWNGNLSDTAPGNIQMLSIGRSLTASGQLLAGSIDLLTVGPDLLSAGHDMGGQIIVSGLLTEMRVAGGTPGTISAGSVGSVRAYGGFGPVVLRIQENGIQRRLEAAVPNNPFPIAALPPAPPPNVLPEGVLFQYVYESGGLASPQLTIRVINSVSTQPDQFDLSLVVYSNTAQFNLARLDASGVSGIRNVAVEGSLLTGVTPAAASFFGLPPDSPGGVQLPQDALAGVAVRDNATAGTVLAASIQGVAFGSLTAADSSTVTADAASAADAASLLNPVTVIVQAGDTFRIPFADVQKVAFFFATLSGGSFDTNKVLFTDQMPNTPRGSVTALVIVVVQLSGDGTPLNSVIQEINLRGDGGAIQTNQSITQAITSTGPLGDLNLTAPEGIVARVTAPSIFGNINAPSISGIIQTTGLRTDPITGQVSTVAADFGQALVDSSGMIVGTTTVSAPGGLSGKLISRGNLISQVMTTQLSGLIAAQGDIGIIQLNPDGTPALDSSGNLIRFGGIQSNGGMSGAQIVALGNIFGDIVTDGNLQSTRITAKGRAITGLNSTRIGILGNVIVNGTMDASSAILSGGEIGDVNGGSFQVGVVQGIVAAEGDIVLGPAVDTSQAIFYQAAIGTGNANAAAIDAIFADGGQPLGFDLLGLDLGGLALILQDLTALSVGSDGNLTGTVP
jgi:hypothetical protein